MHIVDNTQVIGTVHETAQRAISADGQHFQVGQLTRAYLYLRQTSRALLQFGSLILACHVYYEFSPVRSDQSTYHALLHLFLNKARWADKPASLGRSFMDALMQINK